MSRNRFAQEQNRMPSSTVRVEEPLSDTACTDESVIEGAHIPDEPELRYHRETQALIELLGNIYDLYICKEQRELILQQIALRSKRRKVGSLLDRSLA